MERILFLVMTTGGSQLAVPVGQLCIGSSEYKMAKKKTANAVFTLAVRSLKSLARISYHTKLLQRNEKN